MKNFLAVVACVGQMFLVLYVIALLQFYVAASKPSTGVTTFLNLLTIVIAITDLTLVNFLVWRAVKRDSKMKRLFIIVGTIGVFAVMLLGTGRNITPTKQAKQVSSTTPVAQMLPSETPFDVGALVNQINQERQSKGIAPLRHNIVLDQTAQAHAEDMKTRGYYNHVTPDGVSYGTRVSNALPNATYAGENEDADCSNNDPNDAYHRFLISPGHDANQIDSTYTDIGVGYVKTDRGACNGYVVVDFAQIR